MQGHFSYTSKVERPRVCHPFGGPPAIQTVAVVQQKGGVGKTTVAVNLASGLAEAGKRTLLIDLDPLGSASRYLGFGLRDECSAADVITGRAGLMPSSEAGTPISDIEAAIERILPSESRVLPSAARALGEIPGLFFVPSSRSLTRLERHLKEANRLKEALTHVDPEQIDVVIIDTPPRWDLLTINALAAVRIVIAPTELKPLSLMALTRLTEGITKIRRKTNPGLDPIPWVVPSRVRRTRMSTWCLGGLAESYPGRVLPSIRESTRVAEAPGFHMPVAKYAPRSIGATDFEALTEAVLERVFDTAPLAWTAPH